MKVKAYVRIAKPDTGRPKITATVKPSDEPLKDSYGDALPTVSFAVEFDIADSAFKQAEQLIATVSVKHPQPIATVREVQS